MQLFIEAEHPAVRQLTQTKQQGFLERAHGFDFVEQRVRLDLNQTSQLPLELADLLGRLFLLLASLQQRGMILLREELVPDLNVGLLSAPGDVQQISLFQFEALEQVKWNLQFHHVCFSGGPILTPTPEPQTLQGAPDMFENAYSRGHAINANESVVDFLQLKTVTCGANAEGVS
ncbi:MAG: hypothetical protein IH623_28340 [Verrucomicrobia bacterium]|nr:hypothetical protein [Verrucomicrobiota bacterium]